MFSHRFLHRLSSLDFGRTSKMAWDMLAEISHEPSTKTIWCVGNVDKHIDGSYFTCKSARDISKSSMGNGNSNTISNFGRPQAVQHVTQATRNLPYASYDHLLCSNHRIIADNPSRIEPRPTYESFIVKICQVLVIPLRESIVTYSYYHCSH